MQAHQRKTTKEKADPKESAGKDPHESMCGGDEIKHWHPPHPDHPSGQIVTGSALARLSRS